MFHICNSFFAWLNLVNRNHEGIVSNDYGKYFFLVTIMFEMIGGENESLQWDSSPAEWTITTGATQLFIIDKINDDHKYVSIMIRVITMAILTTSRSTN